MGSDPLFQHRLFDGLGELPDSHSIPLSAPADIHSACASVQDGSFDASVVRSTFTFLDLFLLLSPHQLL